MTKEQEAIEKLTNGEKIDFNTLVRKLKKEGTENFVITKKEYIETVLSMLKEKDRKINSKNGEINALQCALKERTEGRDRKDELYNKALSDLVNAENKNIEQDREIEKLKKENDLAKEQLKKQCEIADERNNLLVKVNRLESQIDLMANYIATLDIEEDICANVENDNCDKMNFGECEDCIKQYFERKSEE